MSENPKIEGIVFKHGDDDYSFWMPDISKEENEKFVQTLFSALATTMQRIVFRSSLPSTRRQLSLATARISPTSSATCSMQRCNSKARFCPRSCSKRQPPRGEQRTTGNSPGKSSFRTEGGIALCEYNRSRTLPILSITTITVIAVYPKAEKAKNPSRNPRCRSFLMQ